MRHVRRKWSRSWRVSAKIQQHLRIIIVIKLIFKQMSKNTNLFLLSFSLPHNIHCAPCIWCTGAEAIVRECSPASFFIASVYNIWSHADNQEVTVLKRGYLEGCPQWMCVCLFKIWLFRTVWLWLAAFSRTTRPNNMSEWVTDVISHRKPKTQEWLKLG